MNIILACFPSAERTAVIAVFTDGDAIFICDDYGSPDGNTSIMISPQDAQQLGAILKDAPAALVEVRKVLAAQMVPAPQGK